ncbi:MAG: GGDEF domain-containing protein [Lachnospiraceae bacterium]|nr:GGDEF domain-containing protein [Lachnospiraceae bacterium]
MKKINILTIIYGVILCAIILYMLFYTDMLKKVYSDDVIKLSKEWALIDNGETAHVDVDKLDASEYDGEALLRAVLPTDPDLISDKDLCFWSDNAKFKVCIDNTLVYSFDYGENLTGKGYGRKYHVVKLSSLDAGKSIDITLDTVFEDRSGGRVGGFCLANGMNYIREVSSRQFPACFLSVIVIFFGLMMLAVYIWIPDKRALPYDIAMLGITTLLGGLWCLSQSGMMQLITGKSIGFRMIEYFFMELVIYPLTCFVNSVTILKRKIYPKIATYVMVFIISFQLLMRYVFDTDMHRVLIYTYITYIITFVLIVVMLIDNEIYCRKNEISVNLKYFYTGGVMFIIGSVIDIFIYYMDNPITQNGTFMRVGLCTWVIAMLLQFLIWWAGEHVIIEKERAMQKKLFGYSFKDSLTGVGNRRALDDFEKTKLERTKPFGYIMCDINGLKRTNDTKGHEAGDHLIIDVVTCLKEVFGPENVFRIGGDEFVAYVLDTSREEIKRQVEYANELIEQKGHSASIGSVYCDDRSMSLGDIKKQADALMYAAKKNYYQGREDRRDRKNG